MGGDMGRPGMAGIDALAQNTVGLRAAFCVASHTGLGGSENGRFASEVGVTLDRAVIGRLEEYLGGVLRVEEALGKVELGRVEDCRMVRFELGRVEEGTVEAARVVPGPMLETGGGDEGSTEVARVNALEPGFEKEAAGCVTWGWWEVGFCEGIAAHDGGGVTPGRTQGLLTGILNAMVSEEEYEEKKGDVGCGLVGW